MIQCTWPYVATSGGGFQGDNAGVLVVQADVYEAVNKAADPQLEAEAALGRAAQAEKTEGDIRQADRELLKLMTNLERMIYRNAQTGTQPRSISSVRRVRREERSVYEPQTPSSK